MKYYKFAILLSVFTIALVSVNCDHCDDEDLARREKESKMAVVKHTDSLQVD